MSKYQLLWEYAKSTKEDEIKMSYEDIEKVLGYPIDHSFLTFKKELTSYGYEVKKISMKNKTVEFKRINYVKQ